MKAWKILADLSALYELEPVLTERIARRINCTETEIIQALVKGAALVCKEEESGAGVTRKETRQYQVYQRLVTEDKERG